MAKTARSIPHDDEALRTWLSVVRAYQQCSELLSLRLGEAGLRMAEHEILVNLLREPGLSQQRLARRCFTAKSHMSGLLGDMESRGWIAREADPSDGRAKRLLLTRQGLRLAEQSLGIQSEVVALMTEGTSSADLQTVRKAMEEVSARLERAVAAGGPPASGRRA